MLIKLNNTEDNSIELIFRILKEKYPNYKFESIPIKTGETGLIKIDKRYWIVLKRKHDRLTVYCDIQGLLFYLLPELFIPFFAPFATKYENEIIAEIRKVLEKPHNT